MARPKIKITVKERKGTKNCHRGHKVGVSYDFDTERGKICPMVMHVLFPVIDILRYGGSLPGDGCNHKGLFACPDPDVLLVFEVEKVDQGLKKTAILEMHEISEAPSMECKL